MHNHSWTSEGTWSRLVSSKMFDLVYSESLSVASCKKIPTFGPHPSCCLLPWQQIFSWPTVHPHLSGIWYSRCCRGTKHDFSPNCPVLWLRSIVFSPELLIKAGNCAQQELFVCAQVALCMNLLFTFLFVERMLSKCIFKPSVQVNGGGDVQLKHPRHVRYTMGETNGGRARRGVSPLQDQGFYLLIWWESSWFSRRRHIPLYNWDTVA